MRPGTIVKFAPGMSYYHDWLNTKFGVEPGAVGQIVNGPGSFLRSAMIPRRSKWVSVVFPPSTKCWEILVEELEVLSAATESGDGGEE